MSPKKPINLNKDLIEKNVQHVRKLRPYTLNKLNVHSHIFCKRHIYILYNFRWLAFGHPQYLHKRSFKKLLKML